MTVSAVALSHSGKHSVKPCMNFFRKVDCFWVIRNSVSTASRGTDYFMEFGGKEIDECLFRN